MAQCFDRQKGSIATQACLRGRSVSVRAVFNGKKIGEAEVDVLDGGLVVASSHVAPGFRRLRVGTALYEAVTDLGCRTGLPVRSDDYRSPFAEAFWRKQESKGRARCVPGVGKVFDQPTKRLGDEQKRELPAPARQGDVEYWPCERYEITVPCKASSLERVKKRRR